MQNVCTELRKYLERCSPSIVNMIVQVHFIPPLISCVWRDPGTPRVWSCRPRQCRAWPSACPASPYSCCRPRAYSARLRQLTRSYLCQLPALKLCRVCCFLKTDENSSNLKSKLGFVNLFLGTRVGGRLFPHHRESLVIQLFDSHGFFCVLYKVLPAYVAGLVCDLWII